jgi:hypothetical protein
VALIGHLQVANECRAASATLTAASSGPIPKAPGSAGGYLPLQLFFRFEVSALSGSLVSSAPERPCDDVGGLNPLSIKSDCNAADFLD